MLISFVLRVSPVGLAAGVLAGEVEHVATGERSEFRDAEQLLAWCAFAAGATAVPPPRGVEPRTVALEPADPLLTRKSRP